MKILVVYYSRTGNTRLVAQEIISMLNADVEELRDEENRRGLLGYMKSGREGFLKTQARLKPVKNNPKDYDRIVVGTPIWAWDLSSPVRAYLSQNQISGKNVALFCTAGGASPGNAFKSMRRYLKDCEIIGELTISNQYMGLTPNPRLGQDYKQRVRSWVKSLK